MKTIRKVLCSEPAHAGRGSCACPAASERCTGSRLLTVMNHERRSWEELRQIVDEPCCCTCVRTSRNGASTTVQERGKDLTTSTSTWSTGAAPNQEAEARSPVTHTVPGCCSRLAHFLHTPFWAGGAGLPHPGTTVDTLNCSHFFLQRTDCWLCVYCSSSS